MTTTQTNESGVGFDPKCASYHFGIWMIEPEWFRSAVGAVREGTWKACAPVPEEPVKPRPQYATHKGTAIIPIAGPMMKARSKYGGTSTVDVRAAIRHAVNDDSVTSILILIDSPGGTVAGTESLAQDIAAADVRKPTYAHIEDLGASAAYYAASQARRITASPTSLVGSLGTMMVLDDLSKMYDLRGIKTFVVSSGGMKGAGTEGTEVTAEQLEYFQGLVDGGTQHFKSAVMRGRNMKASVVDALFDGRVHDAAKAKSLGMIDAVMSLDSVMSSILAELGETDEEVPEMKKRKQLAGIATKLGAVAMNPDELLLLASVVTGESPTAQHRSQAPEVSQRCETPAVILSEEPTMATEQVVAPAQPPAAGNSNTTQGSNQEIARLNSQAIQNHIENGKKLGREEGRAMELERMQKLVQAAPSRPDLVIDAFVTNQSADSLALAFKAANSASAAAAQAVQEREVEIARLNALLSTGGHSGVPMGIASETPEVAQSDLDPDTRAKLEWDSNPNLRAQHRNNERAFVLYRTNQLKGNVRVLKTA